MGTKIPVRFIVCVMLALATIINIITASNMSIIILAMTKNPYNASLELPDYGVRYEWSTYEQSLVLGSYFWGTMIIAPIAGVFAGRYGARNIFGFSFAIAAVLSTISPLCSQFIWLIILVRFLMGIAMGTIFPSMQALIANWAPPDEKGKFLSMLTFSGMGALIAWSLSSYIIEGYGWKAAFYVAAVILALFSALWFYVVYDTPSKHPRITAKEREFILSKLTITKGKKKTWPPFQSIFSSIPFWALIIFHFGSMFGFYFLLQSVPRYLSEVHSFNITSTGLLASVPCLISVPLGIMFGCIGDFLLKKKVMSSNAIRKWFSICSHFIPGCFVIFITFFGDQAYTCLALLTVALGFNSAIIITSIQNAHDLASNFASTIQGLASLFATLAGYLGPLLVAHVTKNKSTEEEWQKLFFIAAAIFFGTNIIFVLFGSGQSQKWNDILEAIPADESNTKLRKDTNTDRELHTLYKT